jgi:hypothetical protein
VGKNDELIGCGETLENLNATARGRSERRAKIIGGFDGDAALDDRRAQCVGLAAGIA